MWYPYLRRNAQLHLFSSRLSPITQVCLPHPQGLGFCWVQLIRLWALCVCADRVLREIHRIVTFQSARALWAPKWLPCFSSQPSCVASFSSWSSARAAAQRQCLQNTSIGAGASLLTDSCSPWRPTNRRAPDLALQPRPPTASANQSPSQNQFPPKPIFRGPTIHGAPSESRSRGSG